MSAPRPGKPDICPFCASKLKRRGSGSSAHYDHAATNCILRDLAFAAIPENVALWNRRVGKPLWAPERPWEDPDYLATHPNTKEETRK